MKCIYLHLFTCISTVFNKSDIYFLSNSHASQCSDQCYKQSLCGRYDPSDPAIGQVISGHTWKQISSADESNHQQRVQHFCYLLSCEFNNCAQWLICNSHSHIPHMSPMLLQRDNRLFSSFLLKQDGSVSLVKWHVRIPGRITIKPSVSRFDHQATGRPRRRLHTTCQMARGPDADVQLANIGIHSAWRKANDRVLWQCIINAATFHFH